MDLILPELMIGTGLIIVTIIVAALGFWLAEGMVTFASGWLVRPPFAPKMTLALVMAVLIILVVFSFSVWIWAIAFLWLDLFPTMEGALYFSIVAFTTLGFGDVLLPDEWRILGGITAANGLLNMGLYSAMLVEILRRIRSEQVARRPDS